MSEIDENEFLKVPVSFPRPDYPATIPGTQPKLIMSKYKGKFYVAGCTPPEIYERWTMCLEYVADLTGRAHAAKEGKIVGLSEEKVLAHYLDAFFEGGLISKAEAQWINEEVLRRLK